MRKCTFLILICLLYVPLVKLQAQNNNSSLKTLYDNERYYEIVNKFSEQDKEKLSSQDLAYIGWAFYMLDDEKRAKEYTDYAIRSISPNPQLYYLASLIAQSQNRLDEALNYALKAIEQDSSKGDYYTVAGNVFLMQDQISKAIAYYQQGISAKIPSQQAYYMLADTYDVIGEHQKALSAFYDAKTHTDKNSEQYLTILFTLGSLEMDNHQYLKAIAAFSELVKYYSDDYSTYVRLVQCCYALGDYGMGDLYKEKLYTAYQQGALVDGEFADKFCLENFMVDKKLVSAYEYFQSVTSEDATNVPLYVFYVVNQVGMVECEIQYSYINENGYAIYRLSILRTDSSEKVSNDFTEDMDYQSLKTLIQDTIQNGYIISKYTFK